MKLIQYFKRCKYMGVGIALLFSSALFLGCGSDGSNGQPGSSNGTISGIVTVSGTPVGIPGVSVTTDPDVQAAITTDSSGNYSATLPIGSYTLTFSRNGFTSATATATLVAEQTVTKDVGLAGNPVVVIAGSSVSGVNPGDAVPLTATVEALDGSTVQSVLWSQSSSAPVQSITPADALTTSVTLGDLSAYRDELFTVLTEPPITEAQLPPNVELPPGGFVGGLQDRFEVVGLDPFSLEEAGLVTMKVTVTTDSGTYTDEVEIHATLPWRVTRGINSVPIGVPVLMHGGTAGGTQSAWNWTLTPPGGSTASLDGTTLQNPTFTPDVAGTYTIAEANSGTSINVIAGNWAGAITGQDGNGRPEATGCTVCHDDVTAPDKFTDWKETGHAEIFTNNLNTSTHYGENCFPCHTVGFDKDAANGGVDDASDYAGFLAAGLINNPGDNWTTVLASFPNTAKLANIQCENCHGPNSAGHMAVAGAPRISIASEVCGSCHGEPLRHGRFQQWQLSSHSNYTVAIDEGQNTSCARCHTANGFLAWGEESNWGDQDLSAITWTADETHPQTCATCHDPHAIGTTTGTGTNATTRIFDDTPLLAAGWSASGVGNGAICMTCHNTRRGLYNDAAAAAGTITFSDGRAPHGGAQGDMVMGQNAFFTSVGARGPHSLIDDTCVNCHMEKTPPPALLSYNLGGSNHTFFASIDICSECHTSTNGQSLQGAIEADMMALMDTEESAIADLMNTLLAGNPVTLTEYEDDTGTTQTNLLIPAGTSVSVDKFSDFHGRQAMELTIDPLGTPQIVTVQLRRVDLGGNNLFASYEEGIVILKAGWNILMIENDGSLGVHNPPFANAIIGATNGILSITDFTTATAIP